MNIAFCYESVLPARGGCETYIASLAHRLVTDGHEVHLYACRWDATALPDTLHYHRLTIQRHPRFLRPWHFSAACQRSLQSPEGRQHDVAVGFDKISGLDVLYPQGGLYAACADYNLLKHKHPLCRILGKALKFLDPAHHSFLALERAQYQVGRFSPSWLVGRSSKEQQSGRPLIIAISEMVRRHFAHYYHFAPADLRVVRVATNPERFNEFDRPRRRDECRQRWGFSPDHVVALFAGLNYRLKGIEPLLHSLALLPASAPLALIVAGKPDTAVFERLARRLGVAERIRFIGYCKDMRDCYFASDLLVHPTFYDPCSNVVPEALACGLPVITTRNNGACEFLKPVSGSNGLIAREGYVIDDPHDHAKLAWCLQQLLDPVQRASCSAAARRTAAQWTFEHHYREMLDILAEAASRKQAA